MARDDDLENVVRAALMLLESRQAGLRETVVAMLSEALRRRNVAKIEPGSFEEEALWREFL
jgi:hypothetical protein